MGRGKNSSLAANSSPRPAARFDAAEQTDDFTALFGAGRGRGNALSEPGSSVPTITSRRPLLEVLQLLPEALQDSSVAIYAMFERFAALTPACLAKSDFLLTVSALEKDIAENITREKGLHEAYVWICEEADIQTAHLPATSGQRAWLHHALLGAITLQHTGWSTHQELTAGIRAMSAEG